MFTLYINSMNFYVKNVADLLGRLAIKYFCYRNLNLLLSSLLTHLNSLSSFFSCFSSTHCCFYTCMSYFDLPSSQHLQTYNHMCSTSSSMYLKFQFLRLSYCSLSHDLLPSFRCTPRSTIFRFLSSCTIVSS